MATKTKPTPAQIEQMRADVAAYDAEVAEAARVAKEAFFEPLKTALDNDCGRSFYTSLDTMRTAFDGDEYPENENLRAHLGAILSILPNLYNAAGVQLTAPVESPAVEAPETAPEA